MKKTLLLAAVVCHTLLALSQTTPVTSYARSGQNLTFDLNWTAGNYGTIQWQQSADNGATWTDISGATASTFTCRPADDALYRARIVGDASCPPIYVERQVKTVSFNTDISSNFYNSVEMEVTGMNAADADVVEYGFATNMSELSRSFDMMPLTKVGSSLPDGDFTMLCTGLQPNTKYSLRFYMKTADGSVVFGPGKLATTIPGITFSSEDWTIDTDRLRARFKFAGAGNISGISCLWGSSLNDMKSAQATDRGDGMYETDYITGLQPATTYYIKVTADVDGETQEIVKQVRTMTDYSTYAVDESVTPVSHRISWPSPRTLRKISSEDMTAVEYPRVCRIDDHTLLLTYHGGNSSDHWLNCYYSLSYDNGETWQPQRMIFDKSKSFFGSGFWRICNPQATLLDNGWVILSAVANANPETNENCKVICTISKDKCLTWSDPIIVGRGRTWEPHVVQLPGGELELLVSSEASWYGTGQWVDQQIVSARSTDHGETWTSFERASYLQGGRDGMPVPVVMQGNKGVLFTIESPAGGVQPSVVHRNLAEAWDKTNWDKKDDSNRWASGLNSGGGAPYCVQLPSGEIVMLCHTNQAGTVWQTCRPQVGICDNTGHNMKSKTLPATTSNPLASNEGAYYNSLFVKDEETIWLIVTRATYSGSTRGKSSIEIMEGKIIAL